MVVIAHDPDSTIHKALYGCSHACFLYQLFFVGKTQHRPSLRKVIWLRVHNYRSDKTHLGSPNDNQEDKL